MWSFWISHSFGFKETSHFFTTILLNILLICSLESTVTINYILTELCLLRLYILLLTLNFCVYFIHVLFNFHTTNSCIIISAHMHVLIVLILKIVSSHVCSSKTCFIVKSIFLSITLFTVLEFKCHYRLWNSLHSHIWLI